MKYIKFQDKKGTFTIQSPENYSGLYFPLAGDRTEIQYHSEPWRRQQDRSEPFSFGTGKY